MKHSAPRNIDEYIAAFSSEVQEILEKVRSTIRKAAPAAKEAIKYQIPAFTLNGNLVFFAAYKSHLGIYPIPKATKTFQKEIGPYKTGKGTLRFPFGKPIPFDLIRKLVKFRIEEDMPSSGVSM